MYRYILVVFFIFNFNIYCQDFSTYKKLIDNGRIQDVQDSLPNLNSEYPDHPFISYLNAAVNNDGEKAIEQFQSIAHNHPGTTASELSIMKIGEYLYSKGLYTQASKQFKNIPLYYPNSNNIERAVNLMKKSYLATGEQDSIELYIELFSKKYPNLNFNDYDYYSSIILKEETPLVEKLTEDSVAAVIPTTETDIIKLGEKSWVVQVGAFSNKKNADVIVNRLESNGYNIEIVENLDGRKLHLVQIVRYETIEEAIIVGEEVRDKFGIEFRILERN